MNWIRVLIVGVVTFAVAAVAGYAAVVRPRLRAWGVDPSEGTLSLPGDELVTEANAVETRGITIHGTPTEIWPWLVQMGYGRAGWYSYDALDNDASSARQILPEFQSIAAGDVMPTHPGGGFKVKVVEPNRALVLYSDTELIRAQAEATRGSGKPDAATPGLKLSGGLLSASFPDFAASWTFYLEPAGSGETRLIERFRARTPGGGIATALVEEVMGTGILLMTRMQMLGIKERVERMSL